MSEPEHRKSAALPEAPTDGNTIEAKLTTQALASASTQPATVPTRSDADDTSARTSPGRDSRTTRLVVAATLVLAITTLLWTSRSSDPVHVNGPGVAKDSTDFATPDHRSPQPNTRDRLDVAGVSKELTDLIVFNNRSPQPNMRRLTHLGSGHLTDEPLDQDHLSISYVYFIPGDTDPEKSGPIFADLEWANGDASRVAREWHLAVALTISTFGRSGRKPFERPRENCRLLRRGTGSECTDLLLNVQPIIESGRILGQPTGSTSSISAICIDRSRMWHVVLAIPKDASKQPLDLQKSQFYEHLLRDHDCWDAAKIQTGEPVGMVVGDNRGNYFKIPEDAGRGLGRDLIIGLPVWP